MPQGSALRLQVLTFSHPHSNRKPSVPAIPQQLSCSHPVTQKEFDDPSPQCGAMPSTINMRLFAALCLIGRIAA